MHALPVPDGEGKMVVVAARAGKTGASTTADAASGASVRPTGASLISVNGEEAFHRTSKQVRWVSGRRDSGSCWAGSCTATGRAVGRGRRACNSTADDVNVNILDGPTRRPGVVGGWLCVRPKSTRLLKDCQIVSARSSDACRSPGTSSLLAPRSGHQCRSERYGVGTSLSRTS